ncbi:MAG TPA: ChbG/HpnK family deacetylase [Candidatus Acidoferrum sp.]|nr:ChbG/HpnK family deacetylase [Candidatus Acidoferrum sp.]
MKRLILNADDFGFTHGINQAIVRAHREGILTSTTLMANGPAFEEAVALAREASELGVGVHFVLLGGKPVADANKIPSLVRADGAFPDSLPGFVARVTAGRVREEDIDTELKAQVGKIRAAGIEPTHIDSHKHTHAHPRVFRAMARAARELGILRVRNPFERLQDSWALARSSGAFSMQLAAAAAARIPSGDFERIRKEFALLAPDGFLGLAVTGKMSSTALAAAVQLLPEGVSEIMLHPGYDDAELAASRTRLRAERELEFAALVDPESRRALERENIRRVTFRELH